MAAIALQSLPLGFRFHPKDEELVNHYLKNKITGRIKSEVEVIPEIDVCKCEPWELPAKSLIKSEDPEWFFFAPKDRKYPSGHRSNRATKHGYWKATGRDRMIRSSGGKGLVIGMKKTLVFHEGRAPKGVRTYWIMHEYRTTEPEFESGDQGSYVLYRLFNKKSEEKSPSSKTDDLKIHDFSPDGVEEIEIQSNHESPKSDLQEEPIQRPGSAKKQPAGIEMWLADKGQCSTRAPVKPETDRCNMALPHEETKLGETADPLQDVSFQLCDGVDERVGHGFSNISSPMLQIPENPWSSGMNQESHIGSNPFDNDDYLNAFLNSILDSDDCSSGACVFPKESPAESLVKQAPPWDAASCKDSGSNSELEIEPCLNQRFHGSSLGSSDLLPVDGSSLYPESATQLSTLYENASLFPSGIAGPDIYSVDAGESMDELFNSIEEFNNPSKVSVTAEEDFEMPGINIRSSQSNNHEPPSSNSFFKQGMARRRLCLQGSIRNVPSNGADVESNHMVDDEDKNSIPKTTQTLSDSFEESSSDENITDKLDESMEIGIKTRDRGVQHSPNALSPQDKLSSYKILLLSTSDSESQVGDNDKEEVENIEQQLHAGDPLDDKISESKENTLPTSPNKLEKFSIHDADETTSSSSNHQNPESMMRPRKKSANECYKSVKQSSNSMGLMNHSVVAHMIYLVLSVVVLLLVSGIYRLTISTVE